MKQELMIGVVSVMVLLVGCDERQIKMDLPKKATGAVFSPDGKSLAFQQDVGGRYAVGVMDLGTGAITWVENGPGQACHPAWGKDGELVYTHSPYTGTAYSWYTNQVDTGYNLWVWKAGRKSRLTVGRCFDTTPGVSADGKTVYFVSDRSFASSSPDGSEGNMAMFSLALSDAEGKPGNVRHVPGDANGAAISQPQPSPDGRYLMWAEQLTYSDNWHLMAAKTALPNACCRLTPANMAAYGPRWVRGSSHIIFTGYRAGDAGWSVYLLEPKSGALKRICEGREGAVSPDGRTLVYENASGDLALRELTDADWPVAVPGVADTTGLPAEKVLWQGTEPPRDTRVALDPAFVGGTDDVLFVRAEVEFPKKLPAFEHLFVATYRESESGLQLYLTGGRAWFASRWKNDDYVGACTAENAISPGFKGVITGVRTRDALILQVEGLPPVTCRLNGGGMQLLTPRTFHVGHPSKEGLSSRPFSGKIHKLEYGTGWPKNVALETTAKEVFE